MRRIVILGADGMLGNYVTRYLAKKKYHVWPLTRADFDLTWLYEIHDFFDYCELDKEDVIINCAGIIPQRGEENQTNLDYILINSVLPNYLADLSPKVIHITTDCVYNGYLGGYLEGDPHDDTSVYGKSKSLGENKKNTNIRTSIIGETVKGRGLLEWVKSWRNTLPILGYTNHWWNGVTCHELAKVIEGCIHTNHFWEGTRHLFSPEAVNKCKLIEMIGKVYDLELKVNPTEVDTIDRTLKSEIGWCERLKIPSIEEQLIELREVGHE